MRSFSLGLAALALASSLLWAQELKPALQVETANGQTTFRIGERIPLRLTFTNPEGKPYLVDLEPCGNRACSAFETFEVNPAKGWSDPLASYFEHNKPAIFGDGVATSFSQWRKPLQVSVELNEWVRFDEPGDYTITITSSRVANSIVGPNALVTSEIALHIVPASPKWQNDKLQWIRSNRDRFNVEGVFNNTWGKQRTISDFLQRPPQLKRWFRGFGKNEAPTIQ